MPTKNTDGGGNLRRVDGSKFRKAPFAVGLRISSQIMNGQELRSFSRPLFRLCSHKLHLFFVIRHESLHSFACQGGPL